MLRELQTGFAAALRDTQAVPPPVRSDRFTSEQHMQVYRNNFVEGLTGALRAVYPVIEKLTGEGFFRYAAHEYLRLHPPRRGNLHEFGESMAGFLAGFEPAASLHYLADVARLEWAWHCAFHAADAPVLNPARLRAVSPDEYEQLRFRMHPSARLLDSEYPIVRIFEANQEGAKDTVVDLAEGGVQTLVIRRGLTVWVETLAAGEAAWLQALAAEQPLAAAVQAALAAEPGFDLTTALGTHVQRGTLVDFILS